MRRLAESMRLIREALDVPPATSWSDVLKEVKRLKKENKEVNSRIELPDGTIVNQEQLMNVIGHLINQRVVALEVAKAHQDMLVWLRDQIGNFTQEGFDEYHKLVSYIKEHDSKK